MNVTIVIPTYAKDEELCAQALRGVARLRRLCPKDRLRVVIADDAAAPLEEMPEGADARITTDFPRRGNLNGIACIRGLLDLYAAAALADDDWVVKLDSDTYLCHLEWIRGRDVGHVYNNNSVANRILGSCYALTPDAARKARPWADREDIVARIASNYGPEDLCISALCRLSGSSWHMIPSFLGAIYAPGQAPGTLGGNLTLQDPGEALRRPFVTFKDWWSPQTDVNAARVASAFSALDAFADFAEDKPIPEDATGKADPAPTTPKESAE